MDRQSQRDKERVREREKEREDLTPWALKTLWWVDLGEMPCAHLSLPFPGGWGRENKMENTQ